MKTWRLLRERMGFSVEQFPIAFQSRFGRGEWVKPYTDETIKALGAAGVKKLAVITPSFVADCLETIEEIGVENAEYFHHAGGEKFAAIPCLNAVSYTHLDVYKRQMICWLISVYAKRASL